MLVVITGGPGAGKTTLVEALAERGYGTVPEAAIAVIAELNREHGREEQVLWRREHLQEFQLLVLHRQLQEEALLVGRRDPVFLDRGRIDGLAYCRHFGDEAPAELVAATRRGRYDRVFLLETLPLVPDRSETGRTSDRAVSLALGERLDEVYRELGYAPLRVPVASVEERVAFVLDALRLPASGTQGRGLSR